jgi:hypothetical protein
MPVRHPPDDSHPEVIAGILWILSFDSVQIQEHGRVGLESAPISSIDSRSHEG